MSCLENKVKFLLEKKYPTTHFFITSRGNTPIIFIIIIVIVVVVIDIFTIIITVVVF